MGLIDESNLMITFAPSPLNWLFFQNVVQVQETLV